MELILRRGLLPWILQVMGLNLMEYMNRHMDMICGKWKSYREYCDYWRGKAYSRQFSFDKSSMPVSDFGQANSLGDINHRWVLGINNSGDYLYIRYVYPNKNPKDILRIIK